MFRRKLSNSLQLNYNSFNNSNFSSNSNNNNSNSNNTNNTNTNSSNDNGSTNESKAVNSSRVSQKPRDQLVKSNSISGKKSSFFISSKNIDGQQQQHGEEPGTTNYTTRMNSLIKILKANTIANTSANSNQGTNPDINIKTSTKSNPNIGTNQGNNKNSMANSASNKRLNRALSVKGNSITNNSDYELIDSTNSYTPEHSNGHNHNRIFNLNPDYGYISTKHKDKVDSKHSHDNDLTPRDGIEAIDNKSSLHSEMFDSADNHLQLGNSGAKDAGAYFYNQKSKLFNSNSDVSRTSNVSSASQPSIKGPSYEYYGFVSYLVSFGFYGLYLVWAYLPDHILESVGITYYPDRYWAMAVPSWVLMSILFVYFFYICYVLLNVDPIGSYGNFSDEFAEHHILSSVSDYDTVELGGIPAISDIPISVVNYCLYEE